MLALLLLGACAKAPSPRGVADASAGDKLAPSDAGASERDADAAPQPDAGAPTQLDASAPDSGSPQVDAGATPRSDAGATPPVDASTPPRVDAGSGADAPRLPPVNAGFDYQIGGAYEPPAQVEIVSRDRQAAPAAGHYNICYVNGFQAQPDENTFWLSPQRGDLVLRDAAGEPVVDPDWDEMLLDVSTADKRTRLAQIAGEWIAKCARDGFDAVEVDNLDSYSRSGGRLSLEHAVAFMRLLSDAAHAQGLAIAQKNSVELVSRRTELGTDFVVAEECNRYSECDDYTAGYGDRVLIIEYRRGDFDAGCTRYPNLSIVLRDLNLVGAGQSSYVYAGC